MTIDEEILVNQLAQGIVEMQAGESWFADLTIKRLSHKSRRYVELAHPRHR